LRSLVHLDLSETPVGTEGARALASAKGWDRLQWLDLSLTRLETDGLRALLASPNLRQLTFLSVGGAGLVDEPVLDISPAMATEITRLPHLASLRLGGVHCEARSKQILSEDDSPAWVLFEWDDESYRALRAPDRWPPLDETMERQFYK
jgi:hypothetical protein